MKEEMKKERPYCPPARVHDMSNNRDDFTAKRGLQMSSEDALFVLYTSGSTGTPKGVLHTSAGYLLYTSVTHKYIFDIQPEDVYACVADVGCVFHFASWTELEVMWCFPHPRGDGVSSPLVKLMAMTQLDYGSLLRGLWAVIQWDDHGNV